MGIFLRIAAYLFHPLLMPMLGAFVYYTVTRRFFEPQIIQTKLVALLIVTVCIPIVSFYLLRNLGWISSMQLETVRERKAPLMIQCVLLLMVLKMVYNPYDTPELYFFFVGVLFSTLAAFVLTVLEFKASLHMMGVSGVTFFVFGLSVHFSTNLLPALGLLFFVNGWVASSRLYTRSHTAVELAAGAFLGLMPQLILLGYWL